MRDIRAFEPIWENWVIDEKIGEGSFGMVWKAHREDPFSHVQQKAAVKHISIPKEDSAYGEDMSFSTQGARETYYRSLLDQLIVEIDAMVSLRGKPNIVSYEDHKVIPKPNEEGYDLFLRMELLTSLPAYTKGNHRSRTLGRDEVIRLGIDIASALEILESKHFIHRDIKPANVFVDEQEHFKLGDFGTARVLSKAGLASTMAGAPNYMAPEVYTGRGEYDQTVDIYSLGIMLYRYMNNGYVPFASETVMPDEALQTRVWGQQEMPAPSNADPALARVILKACAFKPGDRYQNATELKEDLIKCSQEKAEEAEDRTLLKSGEKTWLFKPMNGAGEASNVSGEAPKPAPMSEPKLEPKQEPALMPEPKQEQKQEPMPAPKPVEPEGKPISQSAEKQEQGSASDSGQERAKGTETAAGKAQEQNASGGSNQPARTQASPAISGKNRDHSKNKKKWPIIVAVAVAGIAVLVALLLVLIPRPRKYRASWKNWDGKLLQSIEVEAGKIPEYTMEDPTRAPEGDITYTFIGWDPVPEPITTDTEFSAKYKAITPESTEITATLVPDTPVPATPVPDTPEPTTAEPEPTTATPAPTTATPEPITDTPEPPPTDTPTPVYNVFWYTEGEWGRTSSVDQLEAGKMPTPPEVEQRIETEDAIYIFEGWEPEIVEVSGNARYKGKYSRLPRSYTITWVLDADTGKQEQIACTYGQIPQHETPSKNKDAGDSDKAYQWVFTGWSPEIAPVTGDAIYTAQYIQQPIQWVCSNGHENGMSRIDNVCVWCGEKWQPSATEINPVEQTSSAGYPLQIENNETVFGRYVQNHNADDDEDVEEIAEPITWNVLARDGDKVLLMSQYGLEVVSYAYEGQEETTWEDSRVREWLYMNFYLSAFTEEEQEAILFTTVDNSWNQSWEHKVNEEETRDKVFLLSCAEYDEYLSIAGQTEELFPYKGGTRHADYVGGYWLRSPGESLEYAATVDFDGTLSQDHVTNNNYTVRPCIWVQLAGSNAE